MMAELLGGVRMRRGDRHVLIEIRIALRERGNRQLHKRAVAIGVVVFLLRHAGVVEVEVAKIGSGVATRAVPGMLRPIDRAVGSVQKNLQSRQFGRPKLKGLGVIFKFSVRPVDKNRIAEAIDQRRQTLVVVPGSIRRPCGITGKWFRRRNTS